jgi:hypothetical protein
MTYEGRCSYDTRDFKTPAEAAQHLANWEPLPNKFPLAGDQERITTWLLEHGDGDFNHVEPDVDYMDDAAQIRQIPEGAN